VRLSIVLPLCIFKTGRFCVMSIMAFKMKQYINKVLKSPILNDHAVSQNKRVKLKIENTQKLTHLDCMAYHGLT